MAKSVDDPDFHRGVSPRSIADFAPVDSSNCAGRTTSFAPPGGGEEPARQPRVPLLRNRAGRVKTTTARILAKALNCENPLDGDACNVCASCVAITKGRRST